MTEMPLANGSRRAGTSRLRRLGCLALLLASAPAAAQVVCPGGARTWIGAAGGLWSTSTNWSPNGAPGAAREACFNTANPTVTLPGGNTSVRGIRILAGTNLTVTSGAGTGNFRVVAGLSADGTFTFAGGSASLRVNNTQTWLVNSAGTVDWPVTAGGRLTKTGSGTLVFSSAGSTHSGGFTVNGGELRINGTFTGEGSVTVNSGATLSGTGTLASTLITIASGGIYSPGVGGTGTLTSNALTLNNGASLQFTVGTSTTGGVVNGPLVLDGVLNLSAGAGFGQGNYTLFAATGPITDGSLTLGSAPAGFSYAYQLSGGSVVLSVGPPATEVELVKLEAISGGHATEVSWEAGTEVRNLGYRVYREESGQRREVSGLIAGSALRAAFDPLAGRNYSYVDPGGSSGARYWLEAIDLKGKGQWFGPVQARSGALSGLRSSALVASLGSRPLLLSLNGSSGQPADPPGLARGWRDPSPRRQWEIAASSGAVKLLVRQDGVYRVPAEQLLAAGFPSGTPLTSVQLWSGGRSIAFRALSADGSSSLQAGDAIEFFGQAADTRYTDTRVYWVTQGLGAPISIDSAPAMDATTEASSFLETLEIRDRTLHISALRNVDTDGFFGRPVLGTDPMDRIFSTPALDVLAPEAATLEVSVQGLTDGAHTLDVLVNGVGVGTVEGNDQDLATSRFTLPPGALRPGDNTVSLVGRTSDEIALELSQRLTYPRRYTFSGPLRFTAPAGARLELTGPAASGAHVLDVTSALSPAAVVTAPSPNGVSLTAGGGGTRIFFAYRDQDVLAPTVISNSPSSWHSADGADLVIIGGRALLPSLRPLADQRTREGLTVAMVDVEDIYDEFSAGEKDAVAIRSFLANATQSWSIAPRYVLLAGAATYDPRGWLGRPELDQVPTVLVWTRYIEAASDDALVTFGPGRVPDLAIGRLPVSNVADMDTAVAKILGRRLATPSDSLLLAHDRDGTIPFSAATAEVRSTLSRWKTQDFARGADDGANHTALLEAMRAGPVAVDYQGHGAEDFWAGRILSTADVDALSGAGSSSLLVAATCLNAYFVDIGREALGSALLRTPNGGAWGVWASSALTLPTEHALLSRTLLAATLDEGLTLGEATLRAKQAVTDPDVRASFHLLGDPSARAVAVKGSALTTTGTPRAGASGCSTAGGPVAALAPLVLVALALLLRQRRAV